MPKINKDYTTLYTFILDSFFSDKASNLASKSLDIAYDERPFRYRLPFQGDVFRSRHEKNMLKWKQVAPYRKYAGNLLDDDEKDPGIKQLLGGLQPVFDMRKDYVDTFKRYKVGMHVLRDLGQPIFGIGNVIKGALTLGLTPVVFVLDLLSYPFQSDPKPQDFLSHASASFNRFSSWLLDGIASLIRGATQVAFTPFLIFKVLARIVRTSSGGYVPLEENQGLQEAVNQGRSLSSSYAARAQTLLQEPPSVGKPKIKMTTTVSGSMKTMMAEVRTGFNEALDSAENFINEQNPFHVVNPLAQREDAPPVVEVDPDADPKLLIATLYELHRKADKAFVRGQKAHFDNQLTLNSTEEKMAFATLTTRVTAEFLQEQASVPSKRGLVDRLLKKDVAPAAVPQSPPVYRADGKEVDAYLNVFASVPKVRARF